MSTYLQTDLLNEPFKIALSKKISLSKKLSGTDKAKIKNSINNSNFINTLKAEFKKSTYTISDIEAVIEFLEGAN